MSKQFLISPIATRQTQQPTIQNHTFRSYRTAAAPNVTMIVKCYVYNKLCGNLNNCSIQRRESLGTWLGSYDEICIESTLRAKNSRSGQSRYLVFMLNLV